jgi:hypothetical protein
MIRWFWAGLARRRKVIIIQQNHGCERVMLKGRIVTLPALSREIEQGKQQDRGESHK